MTEPTLGPKVPQYQGQVWVVFPRKGVAFWAWYGTSKSSAKKFFENPGFFLLAFGVVSLQEVGLC